jgi:hypothetical protein
VTLFFIFTTRSYDGDGLACLSNSFDVRFWFGPALLPDIRWLKRAQGLKHNDLDSEGGGALPYYRINIASVDG